MLTAAVAVVTGFVVAIALSARFPIGLACRFDLDVGMHADWTAIAVAIVAVIAFVMSIAALAALVAATRRRRPRRSAVANRTRLAQAGLPPALVIGSRLGGRTRARARAVPVRSALIGAIAGVMGVVACFTFRAGLERRGRQPGTLRHRLELPRCFRRRTRIIA